MLWTLLDRRPRTEDRAADANVCRAVGDGDLQIGTHPGGEHGRLGVGDEEVVADGGEPLEGDRFIWWNFVSSRKERIVQAAQDWDERRFALVPGDSDERIELPPKKPF